MENHYVYKITDPHTEEYYIGVRSCDCKISEDSYMGSYATWEPKNINDLEKSIVKFGFKSRDTANKFERELIIEHIEDSLNRNFKVPGENFHVKGMVTVKDKHGNTSLVDKNDLE